jgi:hypothetical protein
LNKDLVLFVIDSRYWFKPIELGFHQSFHHAKKLRLCSGWEAQAQRKRHSDPASLRLHSPAWSRPVAASLVFMEGQEEKAKIHKDPEKPLFQLTRTEQELALGAAAMFLWALPSSFFPCALGA